MSLRVRILLFLLVLMLDAAIGAGQLVSVTIGCAAYLVLVLPVLGR